jgi:sugar phosphate isomerase/epimerase
VLPRVRTAGYDAVELVWPHAEQTLHGSQDPAAAVASLLEENALAAAGLCTVPIAAVGEHDLADCVVEIRREMQIARKLGTGSIQVTAGDRRRQPLVSLVCGLDAILLTAEELDLQVYLANAYGTRIEQLADVDAVLQEVQHPRLGLLIDTGEFHAAAVNPRDALRAFRQRTRMIRLGDRVGRRRVPLGEGESNVPAIMDDTLKLGFDGWVSLDPKTSDGEPFRHLATDLAYLQSLLRAL